MNTLQAFDSIDGGKGINTLNAQLDTDTELAMAGVIENIQNVNVQALAGDVKLDMTGVEGLKSLGSNNSRGDLSFTGVGNAVDLTVNGGRATAAKDVTLNYTATNLETEQTINFNAATVKDVKVTGDAATKLNLTAEGDNVLAGALTAAGTVTDLNVSGAGSLDLGSTALTALTKVTATNAGGLTADFSGADDLVSLKTGAGDDHITLASANLADFTTLDLGEGVNTLGLEAIDGVDLSTAKGVSILEVAAWDADSAVELGAIDGVTVVGVTAGKDLAVTTTANSFTVTVGTDAADAAGTPGVDLGAVSLSKNVSTLTLDDGSKDGKSEITLALAAVGNEAAEFTNKALKTIDLSGLGEDASVELDASALNNALTINIGDVGSAEITLGTGRQDIFKFTGESISKDGESIEITGFEVTIASNNDKLDFSAFEGVNKLTDLSFDYDETLDSGDGGMVITAANSQFEGSIVLLGITAGELTADNFDFA